MPTFQTPPEGQIPIPMTMIQVSDPPPYLKERCRPLHPDSAKKPRSDQNQVTETPPQKPDRTPGAAAN